MLQTLKLSGFWQLHMMPAMDTLIALRTPAIHSCVELHQAPSLYILKKLQQLNLSGCLELLEVPLLETLTSLYTLALSDCRRFQRMPSLANLIEFRRAFCICAAYAGEFTQRNSLSCNQPSFPKLPLSFSTQPKLALRVDNCHKLIIRSKHILQRAFWVRKNSRSPRESPWCTPQQHMSNFDLQAPAQQIEVSQGDTSIAPQVATEA
jgi:hypothetical protein